MWGFTRGLENMCRHDSTARAAREEDVLSHRISPQTSADYFSLTRTHSRKKKTAHTYCTAAKSRRCRLRPPRPPPPPPQLANFSVVPPPSSSLPASPRRTGERRSRGGGREERSKRVLKKFFFAAVCESPRPRDRPTDGEAAVFANGAAAAPHSRKRRGEGGKVELWRSGRLFFRAAAE